MENKKQWRRKMNMIAKALVSGMVLCVLIVAGCKPAGSAGISSAAGRTAADIRIAELNQQLNQKFENPPAHFELGQLYHSQGNWSKADWHYDMAIQFNPIYREAQVAKVKMQFDKGDKSNGEYLANMYITQVSSSPDQLLSLGSAFEKQHLNDYALRCYETALKIAADSAAVNRALGYYYLNNNNTEKAKDFFIRSFQLNPNQADVAGELGKLGVAVRIPQADALPSTTPGKSLKPAGQP
jgi:lipopolysaccharide biosynthesis regulator YciM